MDTGDLMTMLNRECTTMDDRDSFIFLDSKIFLDEHTATRTLSDAEVLGGELITALKELCSRYALVLVEESGNQDTSGETRAKSMLSQSGIEIASTVKDEEEVRELHRSGAVPPSVTENLCPDTIISSEQVYLIHAGLTVTFFCDEEGRKETESHLPDTLTLSFHTYRDIASWILAHPHPYRNLRTALLQGGDLLAHGGLVAFPDGNSIWPRSGCDRPERREEDFLSEETPLL